MARSAEPPVIALRVDSIARLFDAFDPFPMPTRDLSRSAEQYIVEWAQELPRHAPPRIVLMAPEAETLRSEAKGLAAAISNHFGRAPKQRSTNCTSCSRSGGRRSSSDLRCWPCACSSAR